MNEWIKVSDKVPDDDRQVLVVGTRGGMQIARYDKFSGVFNSPKYSGLKGLYWMELPPRPGEAEA